MTLSEYKRQHYLANREARLEQMKRYYEQNRERLIQYQREHRKARKV